MWILDQDHVDTIIRPGHQSRKTMITVFFGFKGICLVKILPEGAKLTSKYFKNQVLREIDRVFGKSAYWPSSDRQFHLSR
jgi:hypothetical protein